MTEFKVGDKVRAKDDLYYNDEVLHVEKDTEGEVESIYGGRATVVFGYLFFRQTLLEEMENEYELINA